MARLTVENRKWWILATMTGALSMVLIDETVVGVALPAIQRDLHMSQAGLQWVVNAYLLALASCAAAGGRLGDLLGQARMFRLGALVFVTASAGCGLAQSQAWKVKQTMRERRITFPLECSYFEDDMSKIISRLRLMKKAAERQGGEEPVYSV